MTEDGTVAYWYPLNGGDFLLETAALSNEAVLALVLLRCHATRLPFLPKDKKTLRRMCRSLDWRYISEALSLFQETDDGYMCPVISKAKTNIRNKRLKLSKAGKAGAAARWGSTTDSDIS